MDLLGLDGQPKNTHPHPDVYPLYPTDVEPSGLAACFTILPTHEHFATTDGVRDKGAMKEAIVDQFSIELGLVFENRSGKHFSMPGINQFYIQPKVAVK